MGKKIKVECFKSDNQDFVAGNTYDAEISLAEKQTFMVFCKTYNGFEANEEVEFINGVYDEDRKVGFTVDAKVFQQKFELDLRMSDTGIVCNASVLKGILPEKLKPYNYIVTINNYADAKTDRAKLNNLHKAIQAKRMQFEEIELGEWKKQKSLIMDMEKMIKEFADNLGNGIKALDEKEANDKMKSVREAFNLIANSLPIPLSFDVLYVRKDYDKKTMTYNKITEDMQKKINLAVDTWKLLEPHLPADPADLEQVKELFVQTLDSNKAKAKSDELKRIREQIKQRELEKQKLAEQANTRTQVVEKEAVKPQQEQVVSNNNVPQKKQRIVVEFVSTRPFFDAMNKLILEYKPTCKVIDKVDI